ncbi:SRPBCC family protein [Fodinibius sp. SL11]|uniref:SRPBCC family protein n=1 Tax=Fodinibius sp. SL11 TaxID=3425690 RepID=UPI003F884302
MKNTSTQKGLVIIRNFNAPRAVVWEAWTNPEIVTQWWGPIGFRCPSAEINLREGGSYLIYMRSPDNKDYWSTGTYKEIISPRKLVFSDSFSDPEGNVVPASHYGFNEDFPLIMEVELMLDEINTKTRMTLTHTGIPKGEMSEQKKAGWRQSFDKLDAYFSTYAK